MISNSALSQALADEQVRSTWYDSRGIVVMTI